MDRLKVIQENLEALRKELKELEEGLNGSSSFNQTQMFNSKIAVFKENIKDLEKEEKEIIYAREVGVHASHCCLKHGCKYGEDETCPVVTKAVVQDHICEDCHGSGIQTVAEMNRSIRMEVAGRKKVEISLEPDEDMANQNTPYSWAVMEYCEYVPWDYYSMKWKTIASGWSETREQAFLDACKTLDNPPF